MRFDFQMSRFDSHFRTMMFCEYDGIPSRYGRVYPSEFTLQIHGTAMQIGNQDNPALERRSLEDFRPFAYTIYPNRVYVNTYGGYIEVISGRDT